MRLINIHTLRLTDFYDVTPRYIILSHRWTDDELNYKDFVKGRNRSSAGSKKISKLCDYVREESWKETVARVMFNEKPTGPEVEWVWVDTVCKFYWLIAFGIELLTDAGVLCRYRQAQLCRVVGSYQ